MKPLDKSLLVFLVAGFFAFTSFAQSGNKAIKEKKPGDNIEQYWFIILKTGPKQDFDSAAKEKLFEGHMANITRLYNDGILKVAGPFGKNEYKWRGLFIFDCKTKEEAERIVSTDPAVAAGLFAVDILPWFGEPVGSFKHGKPEKTN